MADSSNYSFQSMVRFLSNNFVILMLIAIFFVGGFVSGSLMTENKMLKGGTTTKGAAAQPTAAAPAAGNNGPSADQMASLPEVTDEDFIRGNDNAKIVLVEYSDFECPFCQRFHPTMEQVMEEYGDDVAWVYRHYPLPFHPNAQKSGEASECVAELGGDEAFWTFTDTIFAKQVELGGKLTPESITQSAEATGVNMADYQECLDSGRMAEAVSSDMTGGSGAGVSGTPGTFIVVDGEAKELIPGALPYEQVKPMIDQYL
jgi:protein-disulfide isomerase